MRLFAEYHSPIRGLHPSSSCSHAITTSDPFSVRRQAEEAENSDTESARRMAGLSMEERCMVVRDIVSRQGNPHLMCPSAAHVGCLPRWRTAQAGGVCGIPSPQLVCGGPVYCCRPTRSCCPPLHSCSTGHSPFDDLAHPACSFLFAPGHGRSSSDRTSVRRP